MKIGLDYTVGVYQGSGVGRYARGLAHALADLDRENDYTLLWTRANGPDGRELPRLDRAAGFPANFRARRLPLDNRLLTAGWQRLRLPVPVETFSGPLDVLHAPDFVAPPARRARTCVTIHDLTFLTVPRYAHPQLRAYLEATVPRSLRRADHVFADSEATRDDLLNLLGVPPEKVSVVYVGADPRFRPLDADERVEVRPRLAAAGVPDGPYLLAVSTLEPRKNYEGLLRAFAALRGRGLPHRLVIAGKRGWLEGPIFAAVADLRLGDAVTFLDFFPDALLPALYACADLFLLPSFYEGFGIPLLEALGCGTPAVVSDRPSLPEIAGGAARLVAPDDTEALVEAAWALLRDADARATLRARGLARARAFDWRMSAARVLARYRAIK
ncbi:MAG TPA: glycosyltransferase family 1 protein [Thermomicrobiales bacterium]|nr:glycosyltransferase family 1 protein [Thermomicrobiales bacterium]